MSTPSQSSPQPLWQSDALIAAVQGHYQGAGFAAEGVSIDTRSLQSGDLFVALKGAQSDGHDYIDKAFAQGAVAALVADGYQNPNHQDKLIYVDNVMRGLEALGQAARQRGQAKIIGVTGSVGKTSIKEALRMALSSSGKTHASEKSYNNDIGVPLSLARMPADCDYAVFEMGMNHKGEISALTQQVRPDIAVLGHIGTAHLENFANLQGIAEAKAEIFEAMPKGAAAVLPYDNQWLSLLTKHAQARQLNIYTYGMSETADAHILRDKLHADCSCVQAQICGHETAYRLGLSGRHHIINSLAVLATICVLKADIALAALALCELTPLSGRGKTSELKSADGGQFTLIDESYNANPESMRAALEFLGQSKIGKGGKSGRRIAVLGDMAELGEQSADFHAALADEIERHKIDLVFCYGADMRHLFEALMPAQRGVYNEDMTALAVQLKQQIHGGDVLMIKGSRAARLDELVTALKGQAHKK